MSKIRSTSGISLVVLILSVVVMCIIATIVIISNIGEDSVIIEAQESIQKLNYEEKKKNLTLEIENFKLHNINNNQEIALDMLLPILQKYGTINYDNGNIVSITTDTNDVILLSDYFRAPAEIPMPTYEVITIPLNKTNTPVTYNHLSVSIDDDGYITLNGYLSSGNTYYVKLTNGVTIKTNQNDINNTSNGIMIPSGKRVKSAVESNNFSAITLSGSNAQEFGILLRASKATTYANRIVVIDSNRSSGSLNEAKAKTLLDTGEYDILNNEVYCLYLYLRNGIKFNQFKFKYTVTEEILPQLIEDKIDLGENSLNMKVGPAEWLGTSLPNFTAEVLPDYSVKFNGSIPTSNKLYVFFTQDKTYMCVDNYTDTKKYVRDNTPIINANTRIGLTFREISGTRSTSSKQFNLLLRSYDASNVTEFSPIQLSMQLSSNDGLISKGLNYLAGTFSKEIKILSIYLEKDAGWTFNNYIFKPTLEILE